MSQAQDNQNRLANFKNNRKDAEEMRRRRSSFSIELRKSSRFDQMLKKRNIASSIVHSALQENNSFPQTSVSMTIQEIMRQIISEDENVVFQALQNARKILSKERNPPIKDMIDSGIVPFLIEFLSPNYGENFQFEACWALTNIASGNSEETGVIVKAGALPKLIDLLKFHHKNVAEQAAWAIGNIAGDGPLYRDQVINLNALPALLELLESDVNTSTKQNVVWTISNLCRNKNPPPPFHIIKDCLPTLQKMLFSTDRDILADTCWSLSYLTDGPKNKIQAVINAGVVPQVVNLLSRDYECFILTPALRTVGNIVTGDDMQTNCVIEAGALPKLRDLLCVELLNIVKEAAWTISNITAGNSDQIQAVMDSGIIPPLITVLDSGDFKSKKEAAWAITNFTLGATVHQNEYLLNEGVLTPLCNLLSAKDSKMVLVVLDAICNILHSAEKTGTLYEVCVAIEDCGGLDELENLQNHENDVVYRKALQIVERFFSKGDDENQAPHEVNGQYHFTATEHTNPFNF